MILRTFGISLLFVILFCGWGNAKLAPDFIHPCNATTRECLVKATQDAIPEFVKGIPSLNLESLDPFVIEKLSIPLNGLKVTFYKGKVSGFRNCIVDDVVSELEKRHFVLEFHCNLTIKGQYDAIGKILLFPINGEGDAKVKLVNLRMKVDINTKYIKDDNNVNHFALKNYKYTFDYGDRVYFDLKNLFKESKELSQTVLNFLNENWKTVAEEFGKPIVDYAVDLAIRTIEKFFLAVPYEELINVPIPKF
ncbi:circadian clock-controlled protein daywake-like [Danaus plexippus]|uniref:circadian clock-controlled protein daywake-like n=1 Tax=Danaus plexippus TaxID=13037 RepID=UPI002AB170C5|nr:circadian clock-controlled protein daywake-like [Danaus plexippus]XP_061378480.1 circadian clock-controlled protein daywake-like [Danaus plexippus]XP_061378481.1 circadian clock-controlled protein daywake-like [Danaus plexippus]XP_061378482.1 circadian clock-controlled protein daywake-like [Danaus plexippus]